jgi:hypothetical protein
VAIFFGPRHRGPKKFTFPISETSGVNIFQIGLAACLIGAPELAGGCRSASPPARPGFDASFDATEAGRQGNVGWADTIVAFAVSGMTVSCTADLPACGAPAAGCGADALLGPSDSQTFALAPGANVLVAFRCATILDHGGADGAGDFTVWANVATDGAGVVEVSPDGGQFANVGMLTESNQSFAIAPAGASAGKFVRISNVGGSDLLLDAIEAR